MSKRFLLNPIKVVVDDQQVCVTLANGRVISNPIDWHLWLKNASPEQLETVELLPFSVWWPDLDEGLDIEGMIREIRSQ